PLVILGACAVHGAGAQAGDNWTGLTRAFLRTSQTLIASLWRIGDAATAALAVPLWDAIQDGLTVPQALRVAIRSLRGADGPTLLAWGGRIAAAQPESERENFHRHWLEMLGAPPELPPSVA